MGFECSNYFIFWDVKIWIKERDFCYLRREYISSNSFILSKIFLRRISIRKPNLKSRINLKLYEKPKMDWNNERINVV